MSDDPEFTYSNLEWKLRKRLASALSFISGLTREDILRCDGGCLTELVREFAIAPPIIRTDLIVADQRIVEIEDITIERKTGATGHIFLVPIEREVEWLEEVNVQKTAIDNYPLAFLNNKHGHISIRFQLSPDDKEDALQRNLEYRAGRLQQYANAVTTKLINFNKELAERMTEELNKRKSALIKAEKALDATGLPRVHNPEHEERAIQIDHLLRSLGKRVTQTTLRDESKGQEVRTFIVHGHDHETMLELKDYVQNTLKLGEPVILRQMPGLGRTLIEKFETEAETVELVFVLLTPDDRGAALSDPNNEKRRARQNVILELGFFLGKLGRGSGRILLLHKGPLEIPSDLVGVEYIDISNGIESASEKIRKELVALAILK